jgi:oxalate decarboxylase/phosphoglucose isomerase-like protein (cupin superfamily)
MLKNYLRALIVLASTTLLYSCQTDVVSKAKTEVTSPPLINSINDIPVPEVSSSFRPQNKIPSQCKNTLVETYIADLESSKVNFNTIKANYSITKDQNYIKTMDNKGDIFEIKYSDKKMSPVGYIWKELADSPIVIGITEGVKSDHAPHFHKEAECYYVVSGRARTLSNNKFIWMEKGQYFYIPSNTIHNTPITESDGLSVLYWYPQNANFNKFKYYWRNNVEGSPKAIDAFDKVDIIRKL